MKVLVILPLATVLAIGCSRRDTSRQPGAGPGTQGPGAVRQDPDGLEGTWRVVSIGGNGKTTPPDRIADMRVTISGQQYTTTKGGTVIERATLTTDPSKQPKAIDLAFTQGEAQGQTLAGIYEVTGGTLRIALAEPGHARPTEIANRAGLRQDVWKLRRE
jgi:uncharacterized protein (TIGR03067 family)